MIGARRSRQAPARPFPSGLMIPNGRKFDGFVAGLFGLGMKHRSASFREDLSISAAGPGRCPNSCSDAVNASPTKSEQSLQAAAGAEPCGTALCGRIDPMCLDSSCGEMTGREETSCARGGCFAKTVSTWLRRSCSSAGASSRLPSGPCSWALTCGVQGLSFLSVLCAI